MSRTLTIPPALVPAPGTRALWHVDGMSIALFNAQGTLYAIDDACPHAGASLSNGKLEGRTVQCRAHGLRFDLATGCMHNASALRVRSYPVVVEDGAIRLVLDANEST